MTSECTGKCNAQHLGKTNILRKSLVQCQGFTVCPRAVSGKQRLCCTPVKPSAGHTLQPPPHSRWTGTAVRKPSSLEGRNSLGKLLNCFPVSKVLVPKEPGFLRHTLCRIPATSRMRGTPRASQEQGPAHSTCSPSAPACSLQHCEHTAEPRALPSASLQPQQSYLLQKNTTNRRTQNKNPTQLQNQMAQA